MEIYKLFSVHVVRYFIYKRVELNWNPKRLLIIFSTLSNKVPLSKYIFIATNFFFYNWLICAKLFIRSILFSPLCVVVIKRETWKKYESYAYDLITCNIGSRHFLPMRCALVSIKKWRKTIHVCMKSFS